MRETHLADIKHEITEHLGVLSEPPKGWEKKVNLFSCNGWNSKYNLREAAPIHEKMGLGVTLSIKEALLKCTLKQEYRFN